MNFLITGKDQLYNSTSLLDGVNIPSSRTAPLSWPARICLFYFKPFRVFFFCEPGTHLSSHIVSNVVFSAAHVLTVVFGMGTGVSPARIAARSPSHLLITQQRDTFPYFFFLRKEVIQPHLPIRLPCYDFTPVIGPTLGSSLLAVGSLTSGVADSHGVTGGVYKTRERIHRGILIRDY